MTFRLLLNDQKNYTENLPKLRPKTFQNRSKIGTYSFRNAVSKTDRKNVSKNLAKARKWTPKCGPKSGTILDNRLFLFDLGRPWEPTCLPRLSQEPSGPVRAFIFTDFRRIWGVPGPSKKLKKLENWAVYHYHLLRLPNERERLTWNLRKNLD